MSTLIIGACHCGRRWSGHSEAHCRLCHRHFSTARNFDLHRPSYSGCADPATLTDRHGGATLKPVERVHGTTWVGTGEYVPPTANAAGGEGIA